MKRTLVFLFIAIATVPCFAQWRDIGWGKPSAPPVVDPILALAAHDTFVFMSDNSSLVQRFDWKHGWVVADKGMDKLQGNVTSFTTLGTYLFAGSTRNGAPGIGYRSSDNGSSWAFNGGGLVCANGTDLFSAFVNPSEVIRSSDSGANWDSISNLTVLHLATAGQNVFIATTNGFWRSSDNGTHWTTESVPSGFSISAFDTMGPTIFAGGSGLFRSTNSGQSWTLFSLTNRHVNALAMKDSFLFAGTDSGVFISFDRGVSWRDVSDSMGAIPGHFPNVTCLAVLDTLIFAAVDAGTNQITGQTYGYATARPISEMIDTTTSGVQSVSQSPIDSIEIYPNPASGTVTILTGQSMLGIRLLNLLGEQLFDLPIPYSSEVSLDLSHFASGTYFIEIETPKGTILRKVVRE